MGGGPSGASGAGRGGLSDTELGARRRRRRRRGEGDARSALPPCRAPGRALQRPPPRREEGAEVASELAKEGGHFSLSLPSPAPPSPAPPHPPRTPREAEYKGGCETRGKVNGEGLRGSPLRAPSRPVHPRSSSLPEARPRRQERPAPSAEQEEEEEAASRRAERQVPFSSPASRIQRLRCRRKLPPPPPGTQHNAPAA